MKFKKRVMASVFGLAVAGTVCSGSLVKATQDNDIGFSFSVSAYQRESYASESRTRSTTNTKDCWKVDLAYSGEGKGTVTKFWLAKGNSVVSDSVNAKQGGAVRYKHAFSSASRSSVRLRACNNNYSSSGYKISGYWDEETGVFTER